MFLHANLPKERPFERPPDDPRAGSASSGPVQEQCPCHGPRFDEHGTPTKGPAKQGLALYDASLEGSVVRFWVKGE